MFSKIGTDCLTRKEVHFVLAQLFGSKSVERILLFLLVNERCYPSQLHKLWAIPLTPIQKALERLEKGGIVKSFYEGKTRLYRFNENYPLHHELETLLKRGFANLTPQEKRAFYFSTYPKGGLNSGDVLLTLWEKLKKVRSVTLVSKSHASVETGWKGKGRGEVFSSFDDDNTIIFQEEGTLINEMNQEFHFNNVYRFRLNRIDTLLSLEHLRFGVHNPVFLFHLRPRGKNSLESVEGHVCNADTYFGSLTFDARRIQLHWRVIGPKKNEEIEYEYAL